MKLEISPIAHIKTDFKEKFGIPRQSGRAASLTGKIVFLPEYRTPDALRGLEDFSHIWLLFDFSEAHKDAWSPTVRPPRLGGNKRVGVFASRSPFRPNPIGLSCVKLEKIEKTEDEGYVLLVSGVDLLDGSPILDIKPYIPHADLKIDATGSYSDDAKDYRLDVYFPDVFLQKLPVDKRDAVIECLADDPRPAYQDEPERIYGMLFAGYNIQFQVEGDTLTVVGIEKTE